MTILRELWTKEIEDEEVKTTYQYVIDLRGKLEEVIKLAHQNLSSASSRYKAHFDKRAKPRSFQAGDYVLLLLPAKNNKLELKWQGPFLVKQQVRDNNYIIDVKGCHRTYHAKLLRRYYQRNEAPEPKVGILQCAVATVVEEESEYGEEPRLETPNLNQTETSETVVINEELDEQQKEELKKLLHDYEDVMTDVPGRTHVYKYGLTLTSTIPIRKKPYPVPQALKATLREEITAMLEAGIIEPSDSPYCSPAVVVKKKDGTNRHCVDFRGLNNVTVFDAEPMERLDDLFQQIGTESNFVSKIDLSKGYWQIPLADSAKPITAFATELGLMQFRVLPFGLQGAPAAFSRMMRKVLAGLNNVKNYIDDIVVHHARWEDHVNGIKEVLERLRKAGLTARPSKCSLGFYQVEFLRHKIGNGKLAPTETKVEAIRNAAPLQTKKQLRSFLGLARFYRRYVPNFSAVVSPLTDATKTGKPNRIEWGEPQERAFKYVKNCLSQGPVLRFPDFERPFILAADASDTGLGAVLMQEFEDGKFPVVYLSKKLLPREQRYSVVERECLALVWEIKSLSSYLIGREFLVETDHAPLLYLNKVKSENGRLMRWALLLHQYRFRLVSVKGVDNPYRDLIRVGIS